MILLALFLALTLAPDVRATARQAGGTALPQESADSGAFVVRLGTDTLSLERYTRRANRLEAVAVGRSPRTVISHLVMTLGPDGSIATVAAGRGGQTLEERAPAVAGTIPLVGGFWLPWELALRRAQAADRDSTVVNLLAGGNARPTTFRRTGPGRFTFLNQFDQVLHARIDSRGRLLSLEIEGGGSTVERVAWLDVDAMARTFSARDSAGRGLGPLSPRDTTMADVHGARIALAYGRPSLRGRSLDVLVPPGQVWRAGSNDASTITTDRRLQFQGYTLAPGSYSMFVLAEAGKWTLILNRQTGMSGLERDPAQDLARIAMQTRTNAPATEKLTIEAAAKADGGGLVFRWGPVEAVAGFRVAQ
ncbi:MAG TPA: DUF2911 domain-containing protein [Gemmatimonadales bacterium]